MNGVLPKVPYSHTTGSIIKTGVWKRVIQLISRHVFITKLHVMVKEIVIEYKLAGFHDNHPT